MARLRDKYNCIDKGSAWPPCRVSPQEMVTSKCWEQRPGGGYEGQSREKGGPEQGRSGVPRSFKAVPLACFLLAVAGQVLGNRKDGTLMAIRNLG